MSIKIEYFCDTCKNGQKLECEGMLIIIKKKDGKTYDTLHHMSKAELIGVMLGYIVEWLGLKK